VNHRKRLLEVALPLEAINKASAREKLIRHGHPSTLHLWWAQRPLAAARAVIFAQMLDDSSANPDLFPTEKAQERERQRLFKIIEDLMPWENTTNGVVIQKAREWQGAQGLAEDVRYYGPWMRDEAEKRIGHLYPKVEITAEMAKERSDLKSLVGRNLTIIAWLWARTVKSPNPAFTHVDVPLASTFRLSTKPGKETYIEPVVENERPEDAPTVTRREFVAALRAKLPQVLAHLQAGNIAPVDLAQAAIGPGMAMFTRYGNMLDAQGNALTVGEALALINQILDEALTEQEGDFDADSRWALAWFEQYGFAEGEFGVADVLARAKNTSVEGMKLAGILFSSRGKVRLFKPEELPDDWEPATDQRLTA
jgi:adenine-specific DNA methylase